MVDKSLASLLVDDSGLRPVEGIEGYPLEFYNFMMMYFGEHMSHRVAPLHLEFCEAIKYRRSAVGAPRTFAKSIILSCFYPIFLALREPKTQVVIVSATQFLAQNQIMQRIKVEIETNELLIRDYGEMVTDKWKADFLRLPNRSEILCRSVTSQVRGLHPTVMILDDAENDEEVMTPEGRDQFMAFMKRRIMPTMNFEKCQVLMVGTILHEDSYLSRVVNGLEPGWRARLYRALSDDGESIWPHLWSKERLAEEKRTMGSDAFEQEYMGNPIPDGKRAFKPEDFQYIEAKNIPLAVNRFVTVDPAIGQKQENDDTAIAIVSMDFEHNIYIEEFVGGHLIPNEIIQALFDIYARKKVLVTGIETVAFQKCLHYMFQDECRRRHQYPLIEEVMSDGTRKDFRIRALQPYYQNKKIFHVKGAPGMDKYERQLLGFPTGRHDDYPDAVAQVLKIMRPGAKPKAPKPHPDSFEAAFQRQCNRHEAEEIWGNQNVGGSTWQ
jgi:predicted phage terminase large subunit-like protein